MTYLSSYTQFMKMQPKQKPLGRQVTPINTYSGMVKRDEYILEKAISAAPVKSGAYYKMTPYWNLYRNMYILIPAVSAGVNRNANTAAAHLSLRNAKGEVDTDLERFAEEKFGLSDMLIKLSKQLDIYGTVFIQYNPPVDRFTCIPASETQSFIVDKDTHKIKAFTWTGNDVIGTRRITADENLYVASTQDIDDLVFGAPKLRSLFTTLDTLLRDEENYQLFLRNGSYPGIMALVSGDAEPITVSEIESTMRALRDEDSRYRSNVITNAQDSQGNPLVTFTTISQQIGERLSVEAKQHIETQVYLNLDIPPKVMGAATSGMGANEYEPAMLDYANIGFKPKARLLKHIAMSFVIPKILQAAKKAGILSSTEGWGLQSQTVEVQPPSQRQQIYLEGFKFGVFSVNEVKKRGFDYTQQELKDEEEDKFFQDSINQPKNQGDPEQTVLNPFGRSNKQTEQSAQESETAEDGESNTQEDKQKSLIGLVQGELIRTKKSTKSKKKRRRILDSVYAKVDPDKYSIIPDLLETPEAKKLQRELETSLLPKANIARIVNRYRKIKRKTQYADVYDLVQQEGVSSDVNVESLVSTMMLYGFIGIDEITRQYGSELTPKQAQKIRTLVAQYVLGRTENLVDGKPEGVRGSKIPGLNPYFDGSLENGDIRSVAIAINQALDKEQEEDKIVAEAIILLQELTKVRAGLVMQDNLIRVFNAALIAGGLTLGGKTKTWLMTVAQNPRKGRNGRYIHLELVGKTIPFDAQFISSDGTKDYWSNQRLGCLCSVRTNF